MDEPSLVVNTDSLALELQVYQRGVLIVQMGGGDSSNVYCAQFRRGKPVLLATDNTSGGISFREVSEGKDDLIVLVVPRKTFPDVRTGRWDKSKAHRIKIKLE